MTERSPFPNAPSKSGLAARDGTMTLTWLAWINALTQWVQRVRVFSFTVDLPSIPSGGTAFVDVSTPGVEVGGWFCSACFEPWNGDLTCIGADVRAANTVRIRVQNFGAGAVDLAAGIVRVRLEKAR